jgi:hypothetical protein
LCDASRFRLAAKCSKSAHFAAATHLAAENRHAIYGAEAAPERIFGRCLAAGFGSKLN